MNVVELKTVTEDVILSRLTDLVDHASSTPCVGLACILLHADGSAYISTRSIHNNRIQMLGMITDLQYTIAQDG